jgi:hypothetical protein
LLLRESGEQTGSIEVAAVTDSRLASGLRNGAHLTQLVGACVSGDQVALAAACEAAEAAMGAVAVRDVLIVAAGFNGITRVADATGIPLDPSTADATRELRAAVIDTFDYAAKTVRYDLV